MADRHHEVPSAPPYGRSSLADVLPSAAASLGVVGFDDVLGIGPAQVLVVLLVDGLGWQALRDHADIAPCLTSGRAHTISAPFPSTTPAGLGSLGTGLPPGSHGMVGATFWLPEEHRVLHPLSWADEPHPTATQPEPTVLERCERAGVRTRSVGPRAFAASGLTRAVLRGGEYIGSDSVGERVAAVGAAAEGSPTLTYCYWGDLDKTGHIHGVDSAAWRAELQHVDFLVRSLRDALPAGARLIVTADHGMVDCDGSGRVSIDDLPALHRGVRRVAGEPRMRHVYAERGASESVLRTWRDELGERAWVIGREEAQQRGLFGEVEPDYDERIGDVLAIARDDAALVSVRVDSIVSGLRGQHGALTDAEMQIPFLVLGE